MMHVHDVCIMILISMMHISILISMMLVPFESVGNPGGGGPLSVTEEEKKKKDWDRGTMRFGLVFIFVLVFVHIFQLHLAVYIP